jgi:hypothetical protein
MARDILRMRKFCIRGHNSGRSGNGIACEPQKPRSTVHKRIRKYSGTEDMSNRPTRVRDDGIDPGTERLVLRLRQRFRRGPCKIEGYVGVNKPDGTHGLSHNGIYSLPVKAGINDGLGYARETWGKKRFAGVRSNSLWQTDFKLLNNDNWTAAFLDDRSRFVTGCREFSEEPCTEMALELFVRCGKRYGFPERVLADRGSQFRCSAKAGKEQGTSLFAETPESIGVEHIVASERGPATTGKIEAFHKGVQPEMPSIGMGMRRRVGYWNCRRPHQESGHQYPATSYFRDHKG